MYTGPKGAGSKWVADNIKNCELKVYKDIGHADLVECPEKTISTTIKFLKKAKKSINRPS